MTLRQARMSKGMMQSFVVEQCKKNGIKMTTSSYSYKENGKRELKATELLFLAKLFDVDPREIELV